jgi:hypothetical protein
MFLPETVPNFSFGDTYGCWKACHSAALVRETFKILRCAPTTCLSLSSRSHWPRRVAGAMISVAPERMTPTPLGRVAMFRYQ